MMLRLYKFNCTPNYPVCQATLIFAVKDYKDLEDMLPETIELAKSLGFSHPDEDATLTYLGTFMPAVEHPEIPYVITAIAGEY